MSTGTLALKFMLVDAATAGLRRVEGHLARLEKQGGNLANTWKQATKDFQVGTKVLMGTKEVWDRAFRPGIDASAELQAGMNKLEAELSTVSKPISDVRNELAQLKTTAQTIGNPLPLDVTSVIETELALKKAGLAVKDITGAKGATSAASFLSVLEEIDPAQAADIVGAIGNQFKVAGDAYFDLSDQISRAASSSATSAAEIGEAMKYTGANATELGIDYKTAAAMIGLEAKVGMTGSAAGTSLNAFLARFKDPSAQRYAKKKLGVSFYEKGQFVGIEKALQRYKAAESRLSQQQRGIARGKMFGLDAGRAAAALLDVEGGYQGILSEMDQQLGLAEKVEKRLAGHVGQSNALRGTLKSIVADGFGPMVGALTVAEKKANSVLGSVAGFQAEHSGINTAVSVLGGVGLAAGLGYGGLRLGKAALGAGKVGSALGIGGMKQALFGTAAGIATGKAVEETTGVTAVYVTNWPAELGGPGGIVASGKGNAGTTGATGSSLATWLMTTMKSPVGSLATSGVMGIAKLTLGVGSAAALGYAIGTVIQQYLEKTGIAQKGQEYVARTFKLFGADWAKNILDDMEYGRERERKDAEAKQEKKKEEKQPVNVTVNVDAQGRATVESNAGLDSVKVQARRHGGQ